MATVVFDATISSFATSSSEVDLSKGWAHVALVIPAMTSNSAGYVQASDSNASGGTYRRLVQKDPASAVASVDFTVSSACTNRVVPVPGAAGMRYLKVETSAIVSFSAAYKIVCSDGI